MPTTQAETIKRFIEAMPVTELLGIEVLELGDGRSVFAMDNRPNLTFDGSNIQGGIVATLADYAAVAACGSALPVGWLVATTGCSSHNLAPANGSRLVAIAQVVRSGKRQSVARADVHNDEVGGPLVLTGLFTAAGVLGDPR